MRKTIKSEGEIEQDSVNLVFRIKSGLNIISKPGKLGVAEIAY